LVFKGITGNLSITKIKRPGSLIFLISDFYYFDESVQRNLASLTRHNDVVMISISDPMEEQLPAAGYYQFSNGHSELKINTHDQQTCENFQQDYLQRQQQLKHTCLQLGMHYMSLSTGSDFISDLRTGLGLTR
jgi:uncharacterized protein (DUF58 family)